MGEELPDGTVGGYTGRCQRCGKAIKTNIQGNPTGDHICEITDFKITEVSALQDGTHGIGITYNKKDTDVKE